MRVLSRPSTSQSILRHYIRDHTRQESARGICGLQGSLRGLNPHGGFLDPAEHIFRVVVATDWLEAGQEDLDCRDGALEGKALDPLARTGVIAVGHHPDADGEVGKGLTDLSVHVPHTDRWSSTPEHGFGTEWRDTVHSHP